MFKKRKYHSAQEKVSILRHHFVEKVSVSDISREEITTETEANTNTP